MNAFKMARAKKEAQRFLAAVLEVEKTRPDTYPFSGSRETGALRRASMDLTRALADLRRPS